MVWTLLLLQEIDAAVIAGDSVIEAGVLESKLIVPVLLPVLLCLLDSTI